MPYLILRYIDERLEDFWLALGGFLNRQFFSTGFFILSLTILEEATFAYSPGVPHCSSRKALASSSDSVITKN